VPREHRVFGLFVTLMGVDYSVIKDMNGFPRKRNIFDRVKI
jgi:hypothetical protein